MELIKSPSMMHFELQKTRLNAESVLQLLMGSFTSRPKMEALDHRDETVEFPDCSDEVEFLDWVREQQGAEVIPVLKRQYRHVPGREQTAIDGRPIRIMQWNILAQSLGTNTDNFVKCPVEALNWDFRKFKILEEILMYDPDIVCLQEVDHYRFMERALNTQGYVGHFVPKPDSPCIYLPDNNGPDGCAIFYKIDKFEFIDVFTKILEVWKVQSNQVALLLLLREKSTRKELAVLSTHLKARKGTLLSSLRHEQGGDLLSFLEKHRHNRPAIVCGDFNAEPSEAVYARMTKAAPYLNSAYAVANEGEEPPYSTWKIRGEGEAKHNLDYVFFTDSKLTVEGCLDAPSESEVGKDRVPSMSYPSDHFSLVCDFSLVPEAQRSLSSNSIRSRQ